MISEIVLATALGMEWLGDDTDPQRGWYGHRCGMFRSLSGGWWLWANPELLPATKEQSADGGLLVILAYRIGGPQSGWAQA